jgi:hypothetical protein
MSAGITSSANERLLIMLGDVALLLCFQSRFFARSLLSPPLGYVSMDLKYGYELSGGLHLP